MDTLPFGGVGNSGMGRYRGKFGFDTFTHEKAVLKRGFFGEALMRSEKKRERVRENERLKENDTEREIAKE